MKERSGETAEARDVFVDGRTVADGEVVEADVCVAGGGVAGLVTALELGEAGVRVALVERGESPEDGEVEGSYPPLATTRAGGVGGTAALWTAELAPGQLGARYAPLAPRALLRPRPGALRSRPLRRRGAVAERRRGRRRVRPRPARPLHPRVPG